MSHLEPLMQRNFLEYASYVIVDRAIPDLRDGCKPVQRRILHTLFAMDDGKFHKVANVIGETMKLHPHGDASIGDALVVVSNKEYFIEKQGNFGNPITGHSAAAARYIECRLTPLARETLFNTALTEFQPSYDGRQQEPVFLPVKLPVLLMLGTEGIAVGMSTRILPHNLAELLQAQIKILREQTFRLYPDFPHGGIMDATEYADGRGKIKARALIEAVGDKKVVIREIPYTTTTESVIASIESAIQKGKVKIAGISDFTTDKVEIELTLSRGIYADEVIPQLYAYTECEVSISSNILTIVDRRPVELSVTEVLRSLTDKLRDQIKREIEHELGELVDKQHWLTLEQIFIEHRVYKRIEKAETEEAVVAEVHKGMQPFAESFIREMDDADVRRLLELRIRRISAYDINKNRQDIDDIIRGIKKCKAQLKQLTETTIAYLEELLKKYGAQYPRRTRVRAFESVDRKAVARQTIKLSYDPETGFFGSDVKGGEYPLTVSEYDVVLAICDDGTYRIMTPQPKVLLSGKVLFLNIFNPEKGESFTVVYKDTKRHLFAKRVHIQAFIRNKEYELIPGKEGKMELLTSADPPPVIQFSFIPGARQKAQDMKFDLATLEPTSTTARGVRLAPKPVGRVTVAK